MSWQEKQQVLGKLLKVDDFESEEHFEEWKDWELDDVILEKKIDKAFFEFLNY